MDSKYYHGEEFPIGSVVYFLFRPKGEYRQRIDCGIVVENRTYDIYADRLCPYYFDRTINGVPVDDIEFPTRWKKLPKGWSYNTKLFEFEYGSSFPLLANIDVRDPAMIQRAYAKKWLVPRNKNQNQIRYRSEIDKNKGWRIVTEYHSEYIPTVHMPPQYFYKTYEEAKAALDAENAEFKRQAALTDEEWSKEQIEHDLARWKTVYNIGDAQIESARNMLFSLPRVEDVETRIANGGLQWKYVDRKRWGNVT